MFLNAEERRLLKRLHEQIEPEVAAIWGSLRDACIPIKSFEKESELLLRKAIDTLGLVIYQEPQTAAQAIKQAETISKAARKLAAVLAKHDRRLTIRHLWELAAVLIKHQLVQCDIEEPLQTRPTVLELMAQIPERPSLREAQKKVMDGETDPDLAAALRRESFLQLLHTGPTMLQLVEQLADLQEELARTPRPDTRPTRKGAHVTRFREEILLHLLERLGTGTAIISNGKRVLGKSLISDMEVVAHGITLAAFDKSTIRSAKASMNATHAQLGRMLKART